MPHHIVFRDNGTALVFDHLNHRLIDYEGATHADCIAILRFKGINYENLVVSGVPQSYPVRR